jgi:MHS family citrate/tricarballylate:H+ symporter-like MFS transporter
VYLAEIAPPGHRGFYTAWQSASQQVSIVLAAALGYGLNHWLSQPVLAAWGWRIPFMIGCSIIPLIFFLRHSLTETPDFNARRNVPDSREILASLRSHWRIVACAMLLGGMTTATFNLITVYTPTFGRTVLHLSANDSLLVTLCVGISNFMWLPMGGALSDRIGRKPILLAISLLALLSAYPAFAWLAHAPSFYRLLAVLLLCSFYYGSYNGAMVPALTERMPANIRVVGFSLAFSLSTAVFGGVTLAVSTYLIDLTGDAAAPGYWLSFVALCGFVATVLLYRLQPITCWRPPVRADQTQPVLQDAAGSPCERSGPACGK